MQTLLNDIELDIQELKCVVQAISNDANPTLRIVAKRNIRQMTERLEALQKLLEEVPAPVITLEEEEQPAAPTPLDVPAPLDTSAPLEIPVPPASAILAERIKPAKELRHAISLNDSFRFARELFAGDTTRMNEVLRRLGEAPSLDEAIALFTSEVRPDEENEAVADFVELLKKYFS